MFYSILLNKNYESLDLMSQCEKNYMLGIEHGFKNNIIKDNLMTRAEFCKKFDVNNAYIKSIKKILSNNNVNFLKNISNKVKTLSGQEKIDFYRLLKSKQNQLRTAFYIYFYFTILVHTVDFCAQHFIDLYDYIFNYIW